MKPAAAADEQASRERHRRLASRISRLLAVSAESGQRQPLTNKNDFDSTAMLIDLVHPLANSLIRVPCQSAYPLSTRCSPMTPASQPGSSQQALSR